MIRIRFLKDGEHLVAVEAEGHAGWDRHGKDIVCAAASALLRSAARALARRYPGVVSFDAPQAGRLTLRCPVAEDWAEGVWAVLETGLRDIEIEFPQALMIESEYSR